ncbi:hypothetical protein Goari_020603 [Gossypium aridum]|uniref:Uncharacterized protein n=1 Tax=Gossypium aridum TaxID=34290 RepID=A0A7J8YRX3_GOSAI|nr:hypothetical protein [Gossypium aridum]
MYQNYEILPVYSTLIMGIYLICLI